MQIKMKQYTGGSSHILPTYIDQGINLNRQKRNQTPMHVLNQRNDLKVVQKHYPSRTRPSINHTLTGEDKFQQLTPCIVIEDLEDVITQRDLLKRSPTSARSQRAGITTSQAIYATIEEQKGARDSQTQQSKPKSPPPHKHQFKREINTQVHQTRPRVTTFANFSQTATSQRDNILATEDPQKNPYPMHLQPGATTGFLGQDGFKFGVSKQAKQSTPTQFQGKNQKRSMTSQMFNQTSKIPTQNEKTFRLAGVSQPDKTKQRKRQQPQQTKKQLSQPVALMQRPQLMRSTSNLQPSSHQSLHAYGGPPATSQLDDARTIESLNHSRKQLFPCKSSQLLHSACQIGPRSGLFEQKLAGKVLHKISLVDDMGNMSDDSIEKWLPLHQACLSKDAAKVEELIRKDKQPVDQLSNGQTALYLACQIQSQPVIERLLLARARTDIVDLKDGDTCLHLIARSYAKNDGQLWDLLLPFCLDLVNVENKLKQTPIQLLPQMVSKLIILSQQPSPIYSVTPQKPQLNKLDLKRCSEDEPEKLKKTALKPSPPQSAFSAVRKSGMIGSTEWQKSPFKVSPNNKHLIGPEDFVAHQLLGNGSFGEVFLIERKGDKKLLAMKVLTKKKVRDQNLQVYALTERNVMSSMGSHPFIVQLLYAFQTTDRLFLVSDYASGGDLSQYLEIEDSFAESKAQLYITEILLALEALHGQDIIYRDLKPDNVLMDAEGHIMLTDFGLSRENVKRADRGAKSFCGSYAYLAPEMIKKKGHGKTVDWYLLGVILYEMLTGLPPYYADDRQELFSNIIKTEFQIDKQKFEISPQCEDLLQKLLQKDPTKRLGHKGAQEIKDHPWFSQTDWKSVYLRKQSMPDAYLAEMALDIIKQQPYLVAGHPSTMGKPCPRDHPAYLKNWSFVLSKQQ